MGLEALCRARFNHQTARGKAQLETGSLIFRGGFRVAVPLAQLSGIEAASGDLKLRWAGGELVLELGPAASRWADKILNPPSRLDKLGIRAGSAVALKGRFEDDFKAELAARSVVAHSRLKKDLGVVLLRADAVDDLTAITRLLPALGPESALWIVYPKGRKEITQDHVLKAGRAAGLVDIKVVSFSATHTTLKFVRPKAKR